MKSLTIRLPDVLAKRIEQESLARHVSKSDIVRERLAGGAGGSTQDMIGDILARSWKAKVPETPVRFRSAHKQRLAEIIRGKKQHR